MENNEHPRCCICGKECESKWGNNPAPLPVEENDVCCNECNMSIVLSARINPDLSFIKGFSKINITNVCKELGIDRTNLLKGNTSSNNYKKVRNAILEKLRKLPSGEGD